MNGDDEELARSYDVGFTMEDPAEIQARAQAEFEEQQSSDTEDFGRWSAGRDASTSQEFWDALDATDPLSFALAGGVGGAVATSPAPWRAAERAHEVAGEPLSAAVRSAEASRRGATGALNRRNKALRGVGVEAPTNHPLVNLKQSSDFFKNFPTPGNKSVNTTQQALGRKQFFQEEMIEGALSKKPPGFHRPTRKGNLYWAMEKVLDEGVPRWTAAMGSQMRGDPGFVDDAIRNAVEVFIREKTQERGHWGREVVKRRAVVASAQAAEAAHNANKAWKVAKGVGGKALKAAGIAGGVGAAAFMPTFMAMKQMANHGKLDATLAYMSYDLKGGPLDEGDLTDATYAELVKDIGMSDKLNQAGILSTDLHRAILQTAIREHIVEQTEIGQEGSPERYLGPFRMGE